MKYIKGASLIETIGVSAEEISRMIEANVLPFPVTIDGQARTPKTDECLYCRRATGGEVPCWKGGSFFVCKSASQDALAERIRTALFEKNAIDEAMPSVRELFNEGVEGLDQVHDAPKTPEKLVEYYRGRRVRELHELARLIDDEFTGTARLTDIELGALLPAKGKEAEKSEGCRSQGKRLRSEYRKSQ